METKNVLFSKPYLDIVFENRNQDYGAYQLRREHSRNTAIGLLAMLSIVVFLFSANWLYERFHFVRPLKLTTGKHIFTEVVLPKIELPKVVEPPQPAKGNLEKRIDDNLEVRVTQTTTQELKKDSANDNQLFADNTSVGGKIGTPEGVEGGVTTIPNLVPTAPTPKIEGWAEIMPEFMGGENAMMKFIQGNLDYPIVERENGISGNAIVSFVVNEDGSVSDIKTVKSTTKGFQRASEEVVAKFPRFKPGMQGNKPVKVRLTIPIKFVTN